MALEGKTILVTRARGQNAGLRRLLGDSGARVVEIPTIEIREPETWEPVDRAVRGLGDYDWIVFTSANAVEAFLSRLGQRKPPRVAVVGIETARRAEEQGIGVELVPESYSTDGLLAALPEDMTAVRLLLPRGDLADDALPEALRARGARVDTVIVYRTAVPSAGGDTLREALGSGKIDCVAFTSGSTARNLVRLLDVPDPARYLSRAAIAVIGPATRQTVESLGLEVAIEPRQATVPSLAAAIRAHFAG